MTVLKYSITKKLLRLPGSYQTNRYKLCIALGINDRTLKRWLSTLKTDKFSIPSDRFFQIAQYFECRPDELLNNNYENQQQNCQPLSLQQ